MRLLSPGVFDDKVIYQIIMKFDHIYGDFLLQKMMAVLDLVIPLLCVYDKVPVSAVLEENKQSFVAYSFALPLRYHGGQLIAVGYPFVKQIFKSLYLCVVARFTVVLSNCFSDEGNRFIIKGTATDITTAVKSHDLMCRPTGRQNKCKPQKDENYFGQIFHDSGHDNRDKDISPHCNNPSLSLSFGLFLCLDASREVFFAMFFARA